VFPKRVRWLDGRYGNVDGIPFRLPVRTQTSPALFAGFTIDPEAARAILPGQELHPCRIWNRGVLVFTVVNYIDTTIGRYVEFCIGVLCTRGLRPAPRLLPLAAIPVYGTGVYIYDLPVSTEISVKGGRGIWGMAKRRANLDFVIGGDTVSSQYDLDGQIAIRIDIPKTAPRVPMYMKGMGYGDFRGMMTKSYVYMKGKMGFTVGGGGAGATRLLVGDHPRMDPIRRLDIDPAPLFTGYAPRIDGVLDDHIETWFLTADEPPGPPAEGMRDVVDLTLDEEWLAPPDRKASDLLLDTLTADQAVGRTARPSLSSTVEAAGEVGA
jgi:hypothetical protein